MINFIILLFASIIIGVLFGVYTWQELRKKSNNSVPNRFKKISVILGITCGCALYTLIDVVISLLYLIVGI